MKSRLNIEIAVQVVIIVLAFAVAITGLSASKTRITRIYNSQTVKGII